MRGLPAAGSSLRDVIFAVNQLIAGRSNATGTVTLRAGETTTTIVNDNVNENAQVLLFPKTADAATELAAGTLYASISRIGTIPTVTITHANSPGTDRTFGYAILGG